MAIPFRHVAASGSYHEIGRQIGEGMRTEIVASIDFFRENFAAMGGNIDFSAAEDLTRGYVRMARRYLPQYVEEVEGVAAGSGVPFPALMVANCAEELTSSEPAVGEYDPDADPQARAAGAARGGASGVSDYCTAVAVTIGGRHIVGHNMDWYVVDAPNSMVFDVTVPDGTRFLGIAGAAYLPMLAMTSHGTGNVSNSVYSNDNRIGVPNAFVRRWTLEAPTLEEARARGLLAARARGTNHMLADTRGRIWDMETSATASAFSEADPDWPGRGDGWMVHTNHYVSVALAPYEGASGAESRTRLATAGRMLADGVARGDDPIALVTAVLRCHEPGPDECICGHPDETEPVAEQGMTVGSMICDLDERRLYACAGPPCENPYQIFEMG